MAHGLARGGKWIHLTIKYILIQDIVKNNKVYFTGTNKPIFRCIKIRLLYE